MISLLRKLLHLGIGASEAVITGYRRPLGYVQILNAALLSATAITLPALPPGVLWGYLIVQCNGGTVRWRDDGVDPTSSIGMTIPDGGELNYVGDINKIKFIDSGDTPILDIAVYA